MEFPSSSAVEKPFSCRVIVLPEPPLEATMGFGFLCCVFAGESEDVFWKGQRWSAAGGSWAVLHQRETLVARCCAGDLFPHLLHFHCDTLLPAAGMRGKPYPFSGVGKNKINSRT